MILPWHRDQWRRITFAPNAIHHGQLLTGISGIGKLDFAVHLAKFLLCQNPANQDSCGQCQSCNLFSAGTHPDMHVLTSEQEAVNGRIPLISLYSNRYQDIAARDKRANPSQVIPVDQVRALIDRFYQSSHISNQRVAIVTPADRLNVNAANALLKLLEEPPSGAYFILVTDQPGLLPATIRSRTVVQTLVQPDQKLAISWLREQGIALDHDQISATLLVSPIDLLHTMESGELEDRHNNLTDLLMLFDGRNNPIDFAAKLAKQEISSVLVWAQGVTTTLIKWKTAGIAPSWAGQMSMDISRINDKKLHHVYDKISKYRLLARDQLNPQLALEEISIALQRSVERNLS